MTPRLKTTAVDKKMPIRRPKKSATGAAVKAPRKVPRERIETIRDSSPGEMAGSPSSLICPLAKLWGLLVVRGRMMGRGD
jgi:hypothetical protein